MSITSERKLKSLSFGTEESLRPGAGSRELQDLRSDVEDGFVALEGRTSMPRITSVSGEVWDSNIGTDSLDLVGVNFLAGRSQASLAIGSGTHLVTVTAVRPGEDGNDITVSFVDPGDVDQTLSVDVTDNEIVVNLATDGDGDITSTAALVTAAINADADAKVLVHAVGPGAGTVVATDAANLAGGTGRGLVVMVGGVEVAIDDLVTDTSISILDGEADSFSANTLVAIEVKSHTILTSGITLKVSAD